MSNVLTEKDYDDMEKFFEGMTMNLYEVHTKKFLAYVVSHDTARAYILFKERLDLEDIGFYHDRKLDHIKQLTTDDTDDPLLIIDSPVSSLEREYAHVVVVENYRKNFKFTEIVDIFKSALAPFGFDIVIEVDRGEAQMDACIGVDKS